MRASLTNHAGAACECEGAIMITTDFRTPYVYDDEPATGLSTGPGTVLKKRIAAITRQLDDIAVRGFSRPGDRDRHTLLGLERRDLERRLQREIEG